MPLFGKYSAHCYICGLKVCVDTMIGRGPKVCSMECLKELERVEARRILGKDSHPRQRHLEETTDGK
jgi:hypothetical protein